MTSTRKQEAKRSDKGTALSLPFSRRSFLIKTSCFGACHAVAKLIPLPALAAGLASDRRVSSTPIVDKGFASVRKVGNGLYATISDITKGSTTYSNGGFLVGTDAALLLEGFETAAGASFQLEALRSVSQVPVKAALDTHYHYDHSMGNAFYGANGVPLWAHASVAHRIVESYIPLQGADKNTVLGSFEKRIKDAETDTERQHAQSDLYVIAG